MAERQYKFFRLSSPAQYVAHIEINRPEKLNAFSEEMFKELRDVFERISCDPLIRAAILSGSGPRAFCAGLDLSSALSGSNGVSLTAEENATDPARKSIVLKRHILELQDCITSVERCEKPIIAILHGISYGLAIDLVLAADIRICAKTTRFSVKEVDIGLAADIGTLSRLPKAVASLSWCKDICLTAREFGAEEANRFGLVSSIAESKEAAIKCGLELANLIAAKSPVATQSTKELINWSRDRTISDGLRYTSILNSAALQTKDILQAVEASKSKSMPRFSKL